jgi:16S rRNA (guanine(966)-N(2))-methyltransferase RsmD
VRIISGKYGGRIIKPPKNFKARPTTELAREGLFNILSNRVELEGLIVLDLFAGTGSIGFEFASRGAEKVRMIEKNYSHFQFIKKAASLLNSDNVLVTRADVLRILPKLKEKYDIVFADPPYDMSNFEQIPRKVLENNILNTGGTFILEHPGNYNFTDIPQFFEQRRYGSVNFSFFMDQ